MKITSEQSIALTDKIRRLLNDCEPTAGSHAVVLIFKPTPSGAHLHMLRINDPPSMGETVSSILQYAVIQSYRIGVEDGHAGKTVTEI